jgi:hypothetical protein
VFEGHFSCFLNKSYSNCLFHVSYGESSKWSVFFVWFNTHWFGWSDKVLTAVTCLDLGWVFFYNFEGSFVNFLHDIFEFTSNMSGMAIKYWSISVSDLTRMTKDNNLSFKGFSFSSWMVVSIGGNLSSFKLTTTKMIDSSETNVVTWSSLYELFVVHFYRSDFSGFGKFII